MTVEKRRQAVEDILRAAVKSGWEMGAARLPEPVVEITWDGDLIRVRFR